MRNVSRKVVENLSDIFCMQLYDDELFLCLVTDVLRYIEACTYLSCDKLVNRVEVESIELTHI